MKRIIALIFGFCVCMLGVQAQEQPYPPYSELDGKVVVSEFHSLDNVDEEAIFLNALIYVVENGNRPEEGALEVDFEKKQFAIELFSTNPKTENRYNYTLSVKVSEHIITMLASDIVNVASSSVIKFVKKLPFERLQPEKKPKHKDYLEEFAKLYKSNIEQILTFITTNKLPSITHWNEIKESNVVKGMNEIECLLSMGKPISRKDQGDKSEWMYDTYTYLFFENGILISFIK